MNKINKSNHFYLTSLLVIVIIPVILISLYEWLAGGVFNGLAGSWREEIINPNILLLIVNPAVLLAGYLVQFTQLRRYIAINDNSIKILIARIVFLVATVIVLVGIFWKAITT